MLESTQHRQAREHAEMRRREIAFLLVFPFLFGVFATAPFFVVGVLQTLMTGGFGSITDVLRGLQAMIPIYLILVLAMFVGEGVYLICRKWR